MDIIIYTDFLNPQQTYDQIRNNMMQTGLIDSLKIIGRPITVSSLDIQIDSVAVQQLEISVEDLENKIEAIYTSKISPSDVMHQSINNNSGKKIPISAFSKIMIKPINYEPKIFIPLPEVYYHEDKKAVKIECYHKKKNRKKLLEFIQKTMPKYADEFSLLKIDFEIIQ
ncbi:MULTISPECIES: hypothetical protein [Aquimarina]|uniref:Uncharacterized protein n=1 Tax=Aquimarina algiphila TaxID=2047982 RepID=A0A554VG58_9FLAO|nr:MULTISPECIES: hypothetical protein [Aquimarina]TSE06345.1 hypothetical protein FOF46_19495 [Aquimarina algiphila]